MSEAKHTRGPWKSSGGCVVTANGYSVVCDVHYLDYQTGRANAHLIAAAPDLLAICQQIPDLIAELPRVFGFLPPTDAWDRYQAVYQAAQAAVAKATEGAA